MTFGDENSLRDFLGQLELFHQGLSSTLRAGLGLPAYALPPLGDGGRAAEWLVGPGPDVAPTAAWLDALQVTLVGEARALDIAEPVDLRSYDLADPDQFASWSYLMGQEHVRIREAAGV